MQREFAGGPARYQAWLDTVTNHYRRRVRVQVLTLEGELVGSLTDELAEGNVTIDVKRKPRRILSLSLVDPDQSIEFEPGDGDMPIYLTRMVRVFDEAFVESLGEWIGPAVFTGPIVDSDRDGAKVSIVGHGKEELAMGDRGSTYTAKRKKWITGAIKDLLSDSGETNLKGIPDHKKTLPERMTVGRLGKNWNGCLHAADALNREIFFDGHGIVRLRRQPTTAGLTIEKTWLASDLRRDGDSSELNNRFDVYGAKPRAGKKRVQWSARFPRKNKASGENLGRNGKSRWYILEVENTKLKTREDCRRKAIALMDAAKSLVNAYSFDCLPLPHLEEWDLVLVKAPQGTVRVRLNQATLPLGLAQVPMTFNSIRKVDSFKRRKGKNRRRRGARLEAA